MHYFLTESWRIYAILEGVNGELSNAWGDNACANPYLNITVCNPDEGMLRIQRNQPHYATTVTLETLEAGIMEMKKACHYRGMK